MNKGQLKEAVGELNLVDTVFEADGVSYIDTAVSVTQVYDLIDQLDEPEKVVVPKFVADYIELNRGWNGERQAYTEDNSGLWFALNGDSQGMPNSVSDWLFNEEKVETFARAWLDGYEVEKKKEKLYYVPLRINRGSTSIYLIKQRNEVGIDWSAPEFMFSDREKYAYQFTEREIKEFNENYWPFAVEVAE